MLRALTLEFVCIYSFLTLTLFHLKADLEKLSSPERITFLQEKLQDIRNHYLLLKSEVASIDRRRKRMKKKERESEFLNRDASGELALGSSLTSDSLL